MRAFLSLLALSFLVAAAPLGPKAHAQQPNATLVTLQPGPLLSRGARFHSLAGFRIPPGGLVAGIVCTVSQPDGRLTDCVTDGTTPAAALPALRRRLKPTAVLPRGTNRPSAAPVLGRASIVLTPEDYPDLTAETAYTASTLKLTSEWKGWAVKPTASVVAGLYPEQALRLDREARVAAICQIQNDGSLACPVVASTAPGMGFEQAGLWLLEIYRAKPRLPGGRRSAGTWVRMMVDFKLA